MSAIIVGLPASSSTSANAKVLRRQQYQKDSNGLETIVETYIVQNENRITLAPAKDTKHSDFSTAQTKFPRMISESISFNEQDGNITEMNVTFVGLTSSSGLPPAIVRIIPVTDAGIYGPDINIESEFVTDSNETELIGGKFSSLTPIVANPLNNSIQKMPTIINGVSLPRDPIAPFSRQGTGTVSDVTTIYYGYVLQTINCNRRGQFLIATATFAERRDVTISISGGFSNRFG